MSLVPNEPLSYFLCLAIELRLKNLRIIWSTIVEFAEILERLDTLSATHPSTLCIIHSHHSQILA